MKVLVLNAGSSSQKSCLYELTEPLSDGPPEPLWEGFIDWTHQDGKAEVKVETPQGGKRKEVLPVESKAAVMEHLLKTLWTGDDRPLERPEDIDAVGHRVVHGGTDYSEATPIDAEVKAAIARLIPLAPNHNPAHLEGIEAIERALGTVPQVAVFDTAFHSRMPAAAAVYPIPYQWFEQGIRRYGFHGISHQYCATRTAELLGQPLETLGTIVCHLGNGCSLAAVRGGRGMDTTMGFTPLEGLMMGTRSGSIDPAILLYLIREKGFDADGLDWMLNKESGFKGVSGVSADLRAVLKALEDGNDRAQLAFDMFVHRIRKGVAAMAASLDRLDAIAFTAGVGENAAIVRAAVCDGLKLLGVKLDPDKNAAPQGDCDLAAADSAVRVLRIRTQEDWAIARACWRLAQAGALG